MPGYAVFPALKSDIRTMSGPLDPGETGPNRLFQLLRDSILHATRHRTTAAGGTITAVVLTLALAVPAGAAGGSIDTSFGVGGDANLNVGTTVLDVLQKSDGT